MIIKCSKCKIDKHEDCFARHSKKKSGRQNFCKECMSVVMNERYKKNPEVFNKQYEHRRNLRRDLLSNIKQQSQCLVCNESNPACLDFHHLEPKNKKANVSQLAMDKVSIDNLLSEIDKCIVLCANCHRKVHADFYFLEIK